jgi:hypothetical protein
VDPVAEPTSHGNMSELVDENQGEVRHGQEEQRKRARERQKQHDDEERCDAPVDEDRYAPKREERIEGVDLHFPYYLTLAVSSGSATAADRMLTTHSRRPGRCSTWLDQLTHFVELDGVSTASG